MAVEDEAFVVALEVTFEATFVEEVAEVFVKALPDGLDDEVAVAFFVGAGEALLVAA